ncbi:putative monooxygenase [Amylocarpus encephaloides]|uniref:Monooxygenase n=1 Tax=Amylocarpus encephaloides TaxID=45428 RepID=A0A9P8C5E6_9HELO|nr:putative monooxygenase [Amylocarpus encephaloides]
MIDFPRLPDSGIKVIVVGIGFAGLTAAIEAYRKGHSVLVLESFPTLKTLGDVISFGPNSGRIFRRWPGMDELLEPICHETNKILIKNWKGENILRQSWAEKERPYGKNYNGHRGAIHETMYKYALNIGIDIRLGHKVVDYFETETEAGVVANGERFVCDVVLAADGVRSRGRTIVLGCEDKPKSSGYAVYRAWFPAGNMAQDPDLAFLFEENDDLCTWIGPDVHFICATPIKGKEFSWVCTHKDDGDIEESWQTHAPLSEARKNLEGWDPVIHKIIDATPDPVIDWKLVYRDPLPTWISPKQRIALIGDAAHPFLPTSIQGASQAMEDGVTLALCLRRSGKSNVQEALRTFEALRYDRVRGAQKTGETTRDRWHKADWDAVKKNPKSMELQREEWILNFDAEEYAEKNYAATVAALEEKEATRKGDLPKAVSISA